MIAGGSRPGDYPSKSPGWRLIHGPSSPAPCRARSLEHLPVTPEMKPLGPVIGSHQSGTCGVIHYLCLRHVAVGNAGGAGTGRHRHRRDARSTADDRLRQRHRADVARDPTVAARQPRRVALNHARLPRMPQRASVPRHGSGTPHPRRMDSPAAQEPARSNPERVAARSGSDRKENRVQL